MTDQIKAEIVALLPRLRRFAIALSGTRDEGDDIVQSACLKALTRLHQYEAGTRLDSWMFRIVQTTFLDRRRGAARRETEALPDDLDRASDKGLGQRVPEGRLLLERVRAGIAALPEDQRAVLALVAIEGLSYRDTAAILEIPVGTVMSRLNRAREKLKLLNGECAP